MIIGTFTANNSVPIRAHLRDIQPQSIQCSPTNANANDNQDPTIGWPVNVCPIARNIAFAGGYFDM